jgi:hypothetical protein
VTFDFTGYDLRFIQKDRCKDGTEHLFTYVYKFYSPITGYLYILRAEYHVEDVFAIKFYCKKDRGSEFKYSKLTNKGDVGNILITCAKVIPELLAIYPTTSFGFVGARTLDRVSGKVESYNKNQRFRVYSKVVAGKIGTVTFEHIEYPLISGYLLVNRNSGTKVNEKEIAIKHMFSRNYDALPDV